MIIVWKALAFAVYCELFYHVFHDYQFDERFTQKNLKIRNPSNTAQVYMK